MMIGIKGKSGVYPRTAYHIQRITEGNRNRPLRKSQGPRLRNPEMNKMVSFRINDQLFLQFEKFCKNLNKDRSDVFRDAIVDYIDLNRVENC